MNELGTAGGALDRLAREYGGAPRSEGTEGVAEVTSDAEVARWSRGCVMRSRPGGY
ncbi:hypothetical protein ABZS83_23350 [Streptomyces sp. NPDC005426]|uniref:hypothetical protein n=1 Tax=Streptomyces sp. NPDC005426 TaxID=3155344 RepID=UPI0033ADF9DF